MSQQQPNVAGTEELIPTKETLTSLKSDVTTVTAIQELIDNALDKGRREHDLAEPLHIKVSTEHHEDEDRTALIVRDDAGGVRRENASIIFTLGESEDATEQPLIGTYGLGAKKALMNLGIPFTVASRHKDAEVGWSYTIDQDWLDDDDWTVEVTPEEDLEPGATEIRVHDLDHNWVTAEKAEEEDKTSTAERLREAFGYTYNLFLSDELGEEEYDINIEVQGESVRPLGSPDYAFTPVDDMYPRRFENITIDLDGWATTDVDITVGLLRESDGDAAGVDVYIQGRQVLYAARDERVGFDTELDWFDPGHDTRLKVIVEMETTGEGSDLPWDTQKNTVDAYNPIMEKVQNWIGRTAGDYHFLNNEMVSAPFIKPYAPSLPEAANDGAVEHHDFSSRSRVTGSFRPGTDREEVNEITAVASAHALMRFRCERAVEDAHVPAYRAMVDRQLNDLSYADLEEIDVDPVEFDEDDAPEIERAIRELVDTHVEAGVQYAADLPIWQQPKYRVALGRAIEEAELTREELDTPESPPADLPTTIEDLRKDEDDDRPVSPVGDDDDPDPEEIIEVALRVVREEETREASLLTGPRGETLETLGLEAEADDDALADELARRLDNAMRF